SGGTTIGSSAGSVGTTGSGTAAADSNSESWLISAGGSATTSGSGSKRSTSNASRASSRTSSPSSSASTASRSSTQPFGVRGSGFSESTEPATISLSIARVIAT